MAWKYNHTNMAEHARAILEFFNWTSLEEVEFQPITLGRFKGLLVDALQTSNMLASIGAA